MSNDPTSTFTLPQPSVVTNDGSGDDILFHFRFPVKSVLETLIGAGRYIPQPVILPNATHAQSQQQQLPPPPPPPPPPSYSKWQEDTGGDDYFMRRRNPILGERETHDWNKDGTTPWYKKWQLWAIVVSFFIAIVVTIVVVVVVVLKKQPHSETQTQISVTSEKDASSASVNLQKKKRATPSSSQQQQPEEISISEFVGKTEDEEKKNSIPSSSQATSAIEDIQRQQRLQQQQQQQQQRTAGEVIARDVKEQGPMRPYRRDTNENLDYTRRRVAEALKCFKEPLPVPDGPMTSPFVPLPQQYQSK